MRYIKHFSRCIVAMAIAITMSLSIAMAESAKKVETAILAGGCFWGMEEVFRKIPGVTSTEVGYAGSKKKDPKYKEVSSGTTDASESVKIMFDTSKISYESLLKIFFRMHDPTYLNRQGNDIGTQYRSEIYFFDNTQKKTAEKVIELVNKSKKWPKPVVTKITPMTNFYKAEDFHQKYLLHNPHGYNDHYLRDFKFD